MLEMKYFILKPRAKARNDAFATASQVAMRTFADAIKPTDPELSEEVWKWANREGSNQLKLRNYLRKPKRPLLP